MKKIPLKYKIATAVAVLTIPALCTGTAAASTVNSMDEAEVIAKTAQHGADVAGCLL